MMILYNYKFYFLGNLKLSLWTLKVMQVTCDFTN